MQWTDELSGVYCGERHQQTPCGTTGYKVGSENNGWMEKTAKVVISVCTSLCCSVIQVAASKSDRVVPAGERHRGAGHFHVYGGHGETLTLLLQRAAAAVQERLSHLLPEVGVEEAVDDGVDAGGGHGQKVAEGEQEVVMADGQSVLVPVWHHVEGGERQPAECKGRDEGDQHDVDATAVSHALTLGGSGPVQHVLAVAETHENPDVAEQDQQEGAAVLEQQQPCGVSEPVLLGRPVLQADLHMWRGGDVRK